MFLQFFTLLSVTNYTITAGSPFTTVTSDEEGFLNGTIGFGQILVVYLWPDNMFIKFLDENSDPNVRYATKNHHYSAFTFSHETKFYINVPKNSIVSCELINPEGEEVEIINSKIKIFNSIEVTNQKKRIYALPRFGAYVQPLTEGGSIEYVDSEDGSVSTYSNNAPTNLTKLKRMTVISGKWNIRVSMAHAPSIPNFKTSSIIEDFQTEVPTFNEANPNKYCICKKSKCPSVDSTNCQDHTIVPSFEEAIKNGGEIEIMACDKNVKVDFSKLPAGHTTLIFSNSLSSIKLSIDDSEENPTLNSLGFGVQEETRYTQDLIPIGFFTDHKENNTDSNIGTKYLNVLLQPGTRLESANDFALTVNNNKLPIDGGISIIAEQRSGMSPKNLFLPAKIELHPKSKDTMYFFVNLSLYYNSSNYATQQSNNNVTVIYSPDGWTVEPQIILYAEKKPEGFKDTGKYIQYYKHLKGGIIAVILIVCILFAVAEYILLCQYSKKQDTQEDVV